MRPMKRKRREAFVSGMRAHELTEELRKLAQSQRETERQMQEGERRQRKLDDLFNGQCAS